ncbi:MAG: hypothetical protein ACI89E_001134, partial [Planctomycetota bacterium]
PRTPGFSCYSRSLGPQGARSMKRKVLIGSLLWTLLITLAHIQQNVGFRNLVRKVEVMRGERPADLIVAFLPVT